MNKYLHIFRYHHEDLILFQLEMKWVYNRDNETLRYFISDSLHPIMGSCFAETVMEISCKGRTIQELKIEAEKLPVLYDTMLDDLSIGLQPKASFNDVLKVLPAMRIHANLVNPENTWYLTRADDFWYLGREIAKSDRAWPVHRDKPETMSSAIPHIMARSIVFVLKSNGCNSLIDFCCGSGTFLIEAASLGMDCTGVDTNQNMINMTLKNLTHFGYKAELVVDNAAEFQQKADCGIVDLPYGFHCVRDEEEEEHIISNVMRNVRSCVFICGSDFRDKFRAKNLKVNEYLQVPAASITRHIHFVSND